MGEAGVMAVTPIAVASLVYQGALAMVGTGIFLVNRQAPRN